MSSWRRLWRELLILLGIRRVTPRPGERLPSATVVVPAIDTGGGYRPTWRMQDPGRDPREPNGGESSSRGNDHGWSGCTMTSSAVALAWATQGRLDKWGGDMRHRQGDLDGGTDLYDARDAFASYGESLTIRSGAGWGALREDRADGRYVVLQGEGNVPGSESFDGGHACVVGCETNAEGRWLFGDPLATGWQWCTESSIRAWAEAWQGSIAYAVTVAHGSPPPPAPAPDCTDAYEDGHAAGYRDGRAVGYHDGQLDGYSRGVVDGRGLGADSTYRTWLDWSTAPSPAFADRWDRGAWSSRELAAGRLLRGDPCDPLAVGAWHRGPVPWPVEATVAPLASWGEPGWAAGVWGG